MKSTCLPAAITAIIMTALICMPCDAFPAFPDPDPAWKNVSVAGKRMSVYCIFKDSRDIVWLGTNDGLFFYDGVTTHAAGQSTTAGNRVYSILEHDGGLLLGTDNGLLKFSFRENSAGHFIDQQVREIRCMQIIGDTLCAGSIYGMFTVDMKSGKTDDMSAGLPHKSVYSILQDSKGVLYAGTYDGIARWNPSVRVFEEITLHECGNGSRTLFVNCMVESPDSNEIFIGTEGNLYRYSPETAQCTKIPGMDGINVKCLACTDDGHLMAGTDNGIFDIYGNTQKHHRHDSRKIQSLANNEIWCMLADGSNVLAGHETGFSVTSRSNAIKVIRLSDITDSGDGNDIHSVFRDSKGILWLSGTNGIIKIADGGKTSLYHASDKPNAVSHNHIRTIKEDSEGNIWFGTDGGLNRYDAEHDNFNIFHIVDKNGKYSSNWVYAIEEVRDNLIIGSYLGGLHYIGKDKLEACLPGGTVIADYSANTDSGELAGYNTGLENNLVNNVIKDSADNLWILCFNDDFLIKAMPDGKVSKYDMTRIAGSRPALITADRHGKLWCAFNGGAVVFGHDGTSNVVRFPKTDSDETVLAMAGVGNSIWISTVSNIWAIDVNTLIPDLLPIPPKSYKAIYADEATGKVYLGGYDEITEIIPEMLGRTASGSTIRMVLAGGGDNGPDMSSLTPGDDGLKIPYDGSLTLTVSTLDYSPDASERYVYKLAKSMTDTLGRWIILPENFNTISMSGMKMGNYVILVKKVGSPGPSYVLPLHVQAPPSLSWWAFCLYALVMMFLATCIALYIHKRNARRTMENERRKSLEEAERKLTFLTGISHDLKTPLSMIIGPASILKDMNSDVEVRKNAGLIYDNAVRLDNLIHRTLEMNYIECAGENCLILSTFDAVDLCRSVFEAFRANNPHKKFIFHSEESQVVIEADIVKFESVMTNLISNACKYSENGSTISCGISRDGGNVRIVVSDDGIGIDKNDQPLVFQRMFRASSSACTHEGTGIGLYLVKQYIELMGGTVGLYSEKGQGSSFIISLPLSDKASTMRKEIPADGSSGRKYKILIVEDNEQISGFIYDLLKKDYMCMVAGNGKAGLSIATSFVPDIIITDELMPVMNGIEMVGHLKKNPRLANIPIIMLTAKADNDTENKSVKAGIDIFMPKPFEPSVLTGRVKHLVGLRSKMQESIRIENITEIKPIEAESAAEKQLALISKVIEDNISDPDLNVNFLCDKCGMQNKQMYRLIKKYMGVGPLDHIRNVRLQKAAMLLGQKRFTVSEICYMTGFKTPSYFAKCFQEKFGVKPNQYHPDDCING